MNGRCVGLESATLPPLPPSLHLQPQQTPFWAILHLWDLFEFGRCTMLGVLCPRVLPSLAHEVCMVGWLEPLERPASFLFQLTVAGGAAAASWKAARYVWPPLQ